jgi:glycosyltransferase involved in cell wall biosynthesis
VRFFSLFAMNSPLFSIITITFNAEKYIEKTIQSVVSQTNQNFEYILIDGKSRDKTLEIVQKYKTHFSVILSEPDKGIYDAMNKGLAQAKGRFVWFVNAGDEIAESTTLEKIVSKLNEKTDLIYGETLFINDLGEVLGKRSELTPHKLPTKISWKMMKHGMLICHQSFIASREICPNYWVENLSADIDWEIEILKKSKNQLFFDGVLSHYLVGGVSNQQLKKSLTDRFWVLQKHFGWYGAISAHFYIFGRGILKIFKEKGTYW